VNGVRKAMLLAWKARTGISSSFLALITDFVILLCLINIKIFAFFWHFTVSESGEVVLYVMLFGFSCHFFAV